MQFNINCHQIGQICKEMILTIDLYIQYNRNVLELRTLYFY